MRNRFTEVIRLIKQSRANAIKSINAELIHLYWKIGEQINRKIQDAEWGDGVVAELADFIRRKEPDLKGFSDKNLWRMKQFYETYKDSPKLSTLLREISWSHNLAIFSRSRSAQEREFYLNRCKQENYSVRELDRQISAGLFERTMLSNSKLSAVMRESQVDLSSAFKDSYVFEFLNLPEPHDERALPR
jgi:predicted nuclease of restriction endonuclease-like (RecB) superfamily